MKEFKNGVRVSIKNLKTLQGFEIIDRGTCPETGRDNVILSCKVGQDVFTRVVIWIDMAQGDYYTAFEGKSNNKEIIALHDPEL